MRRRLPVCVRLAGAVLAALTALPTHADAFVPSPLALPNLNPLGHIYGVPTARTGLPGNRVSIASTLASHYVSEANATEMLTLDGETVLTALTVTRALTRAWTLGAVLPHVRHGGGEFDRAINEWHGFFGLPDGGRAAAPLGAFDFHYRRAGVTTLRTQAAGGGVGDVQLFADFAPMPAWLVQTTLKLPTGAAAQLRGSGGTDLALIVGGRTPYGPGAARLGLYGHAGGLWRGRGAVLRAQARTGVALGQIGVAWALLPALALQVQLDGHTGFYRASDFAALGPALQLGVGGRWYFTRQGALTVAVAEDVAVGSAPDVSLLLALEVHY